MTQTRKMGLVDTGIPPGQVSANVIDGFFSWQIDFGPDAFDGERRLLGLCFAHRLVPETQLGACKRSLERSAVEEIDVSVIIQVGWLTFWRQRRTGWPGETHGKHHIVVQVHVAVARESGASLAAGGRGRSDAGATRTGVVHRAGQPVVTGLAFVGRQRFARSAETVAYGDVTGVAQPRAVDRRPGAATTGTRVMPGAKVAIVARHAVVVDVFADAVDALVDRAWIVVNARWTDDAKATE